MSKEVCDCPEPCTCYAEGSAQGKDKAYILSTLQNRPCANLVVLLPL